MEEHSPVVNATIQKLEEYTKKKQKRLYNNRKQQYLMKKVRDKQKDNNKKNVEKMGKKNNSMDTLCEIAHVISGDGYERDSN